MTDVCLTNQSVVGNSIKFKNYRKKAAKYFQLDENEDNISFTKDQCSCFFAHCVYYNQIRNQNIKTERLRDVAGLSGILACVFSALAIIGAIKSICGSNSCCITLICILFAGIFILKYKYDVECRVRMVLAVYDVLADKEIADRKDEGTF